MHIRFYKSALCPRCYFSQKYLLEIAEEHPDLRVEIIDVASAPRRSWSDGIRMIPALKIDEDVLSGLLLGRAEIADFISRHTT